MYKDKEKKMTSLKKTHLQLNQIKDYAFVASEYPVVITFEDHLTSDLQAKVATLVTETFGVTLFHPESDLKELPSP
ncbi:Phosphoinositide phospholipase C 6 [Camellia lanceoleosa]|uniref:Phosphoinositide phospholipase C 6 n=1 Tax=Camellia lanceoleosa TaxID=1840588 RepID=A0ACC0GF36_9ERIC|nr:Phosphoinositide phospholipase C 6 [Camellia lanceoleosa]